MSRLIGLAGGIALIALTGPAVLAQSRTAPLSVSVVVVPSCSIAAVGRPDGKRATPARLSLACSGRALSAVRLDLGSARASAAPHVIDRSRAEFRVRLAPGDTVVTLQF